MPKFATIAFKDMRVWIRDIAAMGVLLGMPMVLIFILGAAFGGMGGEGGGIGAPVAIVNLDEGAPAAAPQTPPGLEGEAPTDAGAAEATELGEEITTGLTDNESVTNIFDIERRDDAQEVRDEVERGDLLAALIIPAEFSASINSGDPVEVEVLKDPGSELSANIWESIVRSLVTDLSRVSIVAQTAGQTAAEAGLPQEAVGGAVGLAIEEATDESAQRAITTEVRTQAAETTVDIQGMDFYALSMTSMFLVFGAMFGAFSFITERREQTLMRLLTTPTARTQVIGGKMLGIWVLGMLQFTILYVFTRFSLGVEWGGNPLASFVVAGAMLLAVTGLAVLIASLVKTERGAGGFGSLIVQIMALIGGVFFPITILPEWLQPIRYLSIMGWGLEGLQDIQRHGAGIPDVLLPIFALAGMGALFFAFGIWRLRME